LEFKSFQPFVSCQLNWLTWKTDLRSDAHCRAGLRLWFSFTKCRLAGRYDFQIKHSIVRCFGTVSREIAHHLFVRISGQEFDEREASRKKRTFRVFRNTDSPKHS